MAERSSEGRVEKLAHKKKKEKKRKKKKKKEKKRKGMINCYYLVLES